MVPNDYVAIQKQLFTGGVQEVPLQLRVLQVRNLVSFVAVVEMVDKIYMHSKSLLRHASPQLAACNWAGSILPGGGQRHMILIVFTSS